MTEHIKTAADLPAGSIVASENVAAIRAFDGPGAVWRSTATPGRVHGQRLYNEDIDERLARGAQVVRYGMGGGVQP